jgi:hypothetical protein
VQIVDHEAGAEPYGVVYEAEASIGPATHPHPEPTLTERFELAAFGAAPSLSALTAIPRWARSVTVLGVPEPTMVNGGVTLSLFDDFGGGFALPPVPRERVLVVNHDSLELASGDSVFQLLNNQAVAAVYSAIFKLCI